MMMEERELERNLNTMATQLLWSAFEDWTETQGWESFDEVGQYDYDRIVEAAQKLLPPDITTNQFKSALRYFAQRAEKAVT